MYTANSLLVIGRVNFNNVLPVCVQVVRSATARSGPGLNGVTQGSGGGGLKEMHYVLRVLTPAACRSPTLFSEVTRSILRIALPPPAKRGRLQIL